MKKQGIVLSYNGYDGIIETNLKERYILMKSDIVDGVEIKAMDCVVFTPENRSYGKDNYGMARFVRKVDEKEKN